MKTAHPAASTADDRGWPRYMVNRGGETIAALSRKAS